MNLEKLRVKHRKTINVWEHIHQNIRLNGIFKDAINQIIKNTHSSDTERWRKPMGDIGWGYYDYDEDTKSYTKRSGINFINTGYSYQGYIESVLKNRFNVQFPYRTDERGFFIKETVEETIQQFCYYLELYKDYILFDGEIKNHIEMINERLLKISNRSEKLIEDKHKLIWPDSIDYKTFTGGGGNVKDFSGIDGEVVFEESVKSVQCKEVSYIEENEDRIIVSLTMSYKKYLHVDYYAFTNDKKYIVFKNDSNGIKVLGSLSGNIYSFNKDLIVSTNF
mgnify:CR=1 FL=1